MPLQQVSVQELEVAYKRETELRKKREADKARVLFEGLGFSKEGGEGDWY